MAVCLSFLREFYSRHVKPLEAEVRRQLSTADVVRMVILPATAAPGCASLGAGAPGGSCKCGGSRFVELPESRSSVMPPGSKFHFVSHAFNNPFSLLCDALEAHFGDVKPGEARPIAASLALWQSYAAGGQIYSGCSSDAVPPDLKLLLIRVSAGIRVGRYFRHQPARSGRVRETAANMTAQIISARRSSRDAAWRL